MKPVLILYAAAAALFLALDALWLGFVAKSLYRSEIGGLLKQDVNIAAALAFYFVYLAGLTYFVLVPAQEAASALRALGRGFAFGIVAYATYDLTNLATMQGFTLRIALIDMAWGASATAIAGAGAVLVARRFV